MSRNKRSARKAETLLAAPRNPLFNHPLMKKSHVHDKSGKAKRRAEKVRFSKDWYSQSSFISDQLKAILRIPVFA